MAYCPTCGNDVQPDQRFCQECGTRLTGAASASADASNSVPHRPAGVGGGPWSSAPASDPLAGGDEDREQDDIDDFFSSYRRKGPSPSPDAGEQVAEQQPMRRSRRRFNPDLSYEDGPLPAAPLPAAPAGAVPPQAAAAAGGAEQDDVEDDEPTPAPVDDHTRPYTPPRVEPEPEPVSAPNASGEAMPSWFEELPDDEAPAQGAPSGEAAPNPFAAASTSGSWDDFSSVTGELPREDAPGAPEVSPPRASRSTPPSGEPTTEAGPIILPGSGAGAGAATGAAAAGAAAAGAADGGSPWGRPAESEHHPAHAEPAAEPAPWSAAAGQGSSDGTDDAWDDRGGDAHAHGAHAAPASDDAPGWEETPTMAHPVAQSWQDDEPAWTPPRSAEPQPQPEPAPASDEQSVPSSWFEEFDDDPQEIAEPQHPFAPRGADAGRQPSVVPSDAAPDAAGSPQHGFDELLTGAGAAGAIDDDEQPIFSRDFDQTGIVQMPQQHQPRPNGAPSIFGAPGVAGRPPVDAAARSAAEDAATRQQPAAERPAAPAPEPVRPPRQQPAAGAAAGAAAAGAAAAGAAAAGAGDRRAAGPTDPSRPQSDRAAELFGEIGPDAPGAQPPRAAHATPPPPADEAEAESLASWFGAEPATARFSAAPSIEEANEAQWRAPDDATRAQSLGPAARAEQREAAAAARGDEGDGSAILGEWFGDEVDDRDEVDHAPAARPADARTEAARPWYDQGLDGTEAVGRSGAPTRTGEPVRTPDRSAPAGGGRGGTGYVGQGGPQRATAAAAGTAPGGRGGPGDRGPRSGGPGGSGPGGTGPDGRLDRTGRRRLLTIGLTLLGSLLLIVSAVIIGNQVRGGGGDVAEEPAATETAAPEEEQTEQPPAEEAPPAAAVADPNFPFTGFQSESGNLRCVVSPQFGVACQHSSPAFAVPDTVCTTGGASGAVVGLDSNGYLFPCLTEDIPYGQTTLAMETPQQVGEFTCTITYATGVTCTNAAGDTIGLEFETGIATGGRASTTPQPTVSPLPA